MVGQYTLAELEGMRKIEIYELVKLAEQEARSQGEGDGFYISKSSARKADMAKALADHYLSIAAASKEEDGDDDVIIDEEQSAAKVHHNNQSCTDSSSSPPNISAKT